MTSSTPQTVDLGPSFFAADFDSAFFAAKALFDTFNMDVVSFVFNGVVVRIESFTSVGESFERYQADRRAAS